MWQLHVFTMPDRWKVGVLLIATYLRFSSSDMPTKSIQKVEWAYLSFSVRGRSNWTVCCFVSEPFFTTHHTVVGGSYDCWLTQWWSSSPAWKSICNSFHILLTVVCPPWRICFAEATVLVSFWYPTLLKILEGVSLLNLVWCYLYTVVSDLASKQEWNFTFSWGLAILFNWWMQHHSAAKGEPLLCQKIWSPLWHTTLCYCIKSSFSMACVHNIWHFGKL